MNIQLHIERLVLDGLDIHPGQRHLLQAVVETELRRLLCRGEIARQLAGGGAVAQIATENIQIATETGPGELGLQIAGSVFRGLAESAGDLRHHVVTSKT